MYGLASHEYRGDHIVHERAEQAETALRTIRSAIETLATFANRDSISEHEMDVILQIIKNALRD